MAAYGADTYINALTEITDLDSGDWICVFDESAPDDEATKRISPANLIDKQDSDEMLTRMVPFINSGLLFSAETRNGAGVVTSATIAWSRVIPGATDGVFTGTANGTFVTLIESYTATYPDGSRTITVDFNIDTNGQTSNPTITVA